MLLHIINISVSLNIKIPQNIIYIHEFCFLAEVILTRFYFWYFFINSHTTELVWSVHFFSLLQLILKIKNYQISILLKSLFMYYVSFFLRNYY